MENTATKLWKVVVEISHSHSDGNGESRRDTKTRYFDDFSEAEHSVVHTQIVKFSPRMWGCSIFCDGRIS